MVARRKGVVLDDECIPSKDAPAKAPTTATIIHPDKTHSIEGDNRRFSVPGTVFECDSEGKLFIPEKMLKRLLTNQ